MWARVVITVLGIWLMMSPYVFAGKDQSFSAAFLTWNGLFLIALSLLSVIQKFEKAAILIFIHALWLFYKGRFGFEHPHPPLAQNLILTGLLVAMFAIIPLQSLQPPYGQQKRLAKKQDC